MLNLILVMAASVFFAYCSERTSGPSTVARRIPWDIYFILALIIMILFSGLRTSYNDTRTYISGFLNAGSISEFLSDPENLNVLHNPLFYFIMTVFRSITNNYHLYLTAYACFNTILFLRFLRQYAPQGNFGFCLYLYFTIGVFTFSMAALKQITASAILTLAIPALIDKKWIRYFLLVIVAGLIHTYAFVFLFLPIMTGRPWGWKSILLLLGTVGVMLTFESTIGSILEYADSIGKHVAEYEVFDGNQMNPFRVAVFAVVPVATFLLRKYLEQDLDREKCIMLNMSIISFMFMLLASMNGANMFGRLARYFVLGSVISMPWIIERAFDKRSASLLKIVASICFFCFFLYDNEGFSQSYSSIHLISLF